MHDNAATDETAWEPCLAKLQQAGVFQGGSAIGNGICARQDGRAVAVTAHLAGFIRSSADSFDQAKGLLTGKPVFEAGGTVEIRELPRN